MKALISRFLKIGVPPLTAPADAEPGTIEALRDLVRRDVASGFYDEDEILKNACASFDGELEANALRNHAQAFLKQALVAQRAAQRGWPEWTDCDRLDAAFAALEAEGVIARQHFTCCGTCGSAEIWDEIAAVEESGGPASGYAFYHVQDTDRAVDGEGVYLNYGACEEGEEAALAIGRQIVTQIEAHGLRTDWDGSWGHRIKVELEWKRRRDGV